jgi:hypothetical protein
MSEALTEAEVEALIDQCKGKSGKTGEAEVCLSWDKKTMSMSATSLSTVARLLSRRPGAVLSVDKGMYGEGAERHLGSVQIWLDPESCRCPSTLIGKGGKKKQTAKTSEELIALAERCKNKSGDSQAEGGISHIKGDDFVTFCTWIPAQARGVILRNAGAILSSQVTEDGGAFGVTFRIRKDAVRGFETILRSRRGDADEGDEDGDDEEGEGENVEGGGA